MISSFSSLSKLGRANINKYTNAYSNALKDEPNDASLNTSVGICYIGLGMYEKALICFEKVIEKDPENSFGYFAAAISMLNGKSAFLNEKKKVDKAIGYVNAALIISEIGIYHFLMAYLKYDYYKRKYLKIDPDHRYHLNLAYSYGILNGDVNDLFTMLNVKIPDEF